MERVFRHARGLLTRICLGLGVVAVVVGCHRACLTGDCGGKGGAGIDNCSDIPAGAIPMPVGVHVKEAINRQAEKAEADDFVIYYNEWVDGRAVLGPFGSEHIARIIARLPAVPFPVVVQPEPGFPILTSLRHKAIVDALASAGVPDPMQRVFIGRPAAEGLFGEEAERIYPHLLRGGIGGFAGGLGGGFGGGFGGFGGGGIGGIGGGFGFR